MDESQQQEVLAQNGGTAAAPATAPLTELDVAFIRWRTFSAFVARCGPCTIRDLRKDLADTSAADLVSVLRELQRDRRLKLDGDRVETPMRFNIRNAS